MRGGGWTYSSSILPYTPNFGVYGPFALVNNTFAAYDTSEGAVAVRQFDGSKWNNIAGLLPYHLANHDANGFPIDGFGESVAIDRVTGDVAVGAPYGTAGTGYVNVFTKTSGGYSKPHTLAVYDNYKNDLFGLSVAAENGHVIVGSPHHVTGPGTGSGSSANTGFVYNFVADSNGIYSAYDELAGQKQQIQNLYNTGGVVAINGGTILAGAERAAYTFIPAYMPSTTPDSYSTVPNVALTVDAAHGVLANDTNLGTGTMTAQIYAQPTNGALQLNKDGSFTYTPNKNYAGTDTFQYDAVNDQGNSSHTTVTILVATPTSMNLSSLICNEGQSCTLRTTLARGATFNQNLGIGGQTVTFLVSGKAVGTAVTSANGQATLQYKPTAIGLSVITAQYAGSANGFYAPSSTQATLFVRAITMISMAALPTPVGQKVPTTCTIWRTADGMGVSGVTIQFTINKVPVGTGVTDTNGIIMIDVPAQAHAGTMNIVGQFGGTPAYQASSGVIGAEIDPAGSKLSIVNASGIVGGVATLKATLVRSADNGIINGATVTFLDNGATLGTATTVNGTATFSYTLTSALPAGTSTITAQFAGTADYKAANSNSATLTVSTNTALSVKNVSGAAGTNVTLSAKLLSTPGGVAVPGEALAFTVNGKPVANVTTDATDTATCSYYIPRGTAAGNQTIALAHTSTLLYKASSGTGTLTIH